MILENIKTLDVENIGDTEAGIQAGVTEESLPFMFEFVSTQLYANPIGSLIREITSNAHDAHVEAGNQDPVIIRMFSKPDEGWFIEFIDKGIGISPERMLNIYMNYFSSSKRKDNTQIGGFGLGSKTPLAYQDYFYIDTVSDGMSYKYLYHKGELKPTLESLQGYWYDEDGNKLPTGLPTTERNGTTIRILVKDTLINGSVLRYTTDMSKFKSELVKQLTYFDNVYFQNCEVSNDYDIYEGKYFKFRSDIAQHSTNLHISLGNVRYNLDTHVVKIPAEMIQLPVAVKFEVGELKVTPSRESLRYTEADIKKIQERVLLLREELNERFELENPIVENLETFIRNKAQNIKITFDRSKGHYLSLWSGSGFAKQAKYAPLKDYNFKYPDNVFFMWKVIGALEHGTFTGVHKRGIDPCFTEEKFLGSKYMIIDDINHVSEYTNTYIHEEFGYYTIYLITKDKNAKVFDKLRLKNSKKFTLDKYIDNKAKIGYNYIKEIDKQVRKKSLGTYEHYKPTKEWIADYRRRIFERTAAYQRKINAQIFIRNMRLHGRGEDIKVKTLLDSKEIVVYGFKEDRDVLERLAIILTAHYDTNRNKQRRPRRNVKSPNFMVIQVAQSSLKGIQYENRNIIYCKDFFKHKFMVNLKARFIRTTTVDGLYDGKKAEYLKGYKEDYVALKNNWHQNHSFRRYNEVMKKEYLDMVPDIPGLLDDIAPFKERYNYRIPFVDIMNNIQHSEYWPYMLRIIKESHIRILNSFYLKSTERLQYERRRKAKQFIRHFGQLSKSFIQYLEEPINSQNNIKTENHGERRQETQEGESSQREACENTQESGGCTAEQNCPQEGGQELHRNNRWRDLLSCYNGREDSRHFETEGSSLQPEELRSDQETNHQDTHSEGSCQERGEGEVGNEGERLEEVGQEEREGISRSEGYSS